MAHLGLLQPQTPSDAVSLARKLITLEAACLHRQCEVARRARLFVPGMGELAPVVIQLAGTLMVARRSIASLLQPRREKVQSNPSSQHLVSFKERIVEQE